MKTIRRLYSVFPFQDEPFHASPGAFDYSSDARAEFNRRYGYAMPASLDSARGDPKQWLDLLNFQSETFRDGWRQVYRIVKAFDPRPQDRPDARQSRHVWRGGKVRFARGDR